MPSLHVTHTDVATNVQEHEQSMRNVYASHRPITEKFGLWDCLRVDYGTEWFLMLTAQDMLRHHRNDRSKLPYVQTTSKRVKLDNQQSIAY